MGKISIGTLAYGLHVRAELAQTKKHLVTSRMGMAIDWLWQEWRMERVADRRRLQEHKQRYGLL
jgi:hypothetical protein